MSNSRDADRPTDRVIRRACLGSRECESCHPEVLRRIWHRTTRNADASEYLSMTSLGFRGVLGLVRQPLRMTILAALLLIGCRDIGTGGTGEMVVSESTLRD